jgi:hypothetical protein
MSKEAYYFSHDANARQDEKILMLRADHGWHGYGIYWALVEMMFENADTALHHNKIKGISVSYNIDITLLESVINTCITEELFISDGVKFWSETLRRRKDRFQDLKEKKSAAGKKGMAKRWANKQENQEIDNTVITDDNTVITENNKGKEKKERKLKKEKKINNKIHYAEFVSMTLEEYEKLISEHGEANVKEMIKVLDNYKGSSGKIYKDDYRAILNWVVERVKGQAYKPGAKKSLFAQGEESRKRQRNKRKKMNYCHIRRTVHGEGIR